MLMKLNTVSEQLLKRTFEFYFDWHYFPLWY